MWGSFFRSAALALALSACASQQQSGVMVVFTQTPPELPFDPHDAQLRSVQKQLAELTGHGLVLDVDAALLPEWSRDFRAGLIAALENLAKDVRALERDAPGAFASQLPKLERIECRYSAAPVPSRVTLSDDGKVLTVRAQRSDGALVPRGALFSQLRQAHERAQGERFANSQPGQIGSADRAAYFAHLKRQAYREEPNLAEGSLANGVLGALALRGQADASFAAEVDGWLAGDAAESFVRAYLHHAAEIRGMPAGTSFRRAEAGFARWANQYASTLPKTAQLRLLKSAYPRPFSQDRRPGTHFVPFAFPGWERDVLLFQIVEDWSKRGHPSEPLSEFVVCPRPRDARGHHSLVPRCDRSLYDRAEEEPRVAARLSSVVQRSKDPVLTESVFVNLAEHAPIELTLAQWRALLEAGALDEWRRAGEVLNDVLASQRPTLLIEESKRLYRERPNERGLLLYMLASTDRGQTGVVDWSAFAQHYGEVGASEVSALLAVGPNAVAALPIVWDALAPEAKRADLFLKGYDAFLSAPEVREFDFQNPWKAVRAVHASLCRDGKLVEVASLRSYYQARARIAPDQARVLGDFVQETDPKRCKEEHEHQVRSDKMDRASAQKKTQRAKGFEDQR